MPDLTGPEQGIRSVDIITDTGIWAYLACLTPSEIPVDSGVHTNTPPRKDQS